jgi:hypothetical protein
MGAILVVVICRSVLFPVDDVAVDATMFRQSGLQRVHEM